MRTAASSIIQEEELPLLNAMGQQIFRHSAGTQKKSYRGNLSAMRSAEYHAELGEIFSYSKQKMFED